MKLNFLPLNIIVLFMTRLEKRDLTGLGFTSRLILSFLHRDVFIFTMTIPNNLKNILLLDYLLIIFYFCQVLLYFFSSSIRRLVLFWGTSGDDRLKENSRLSLFRIWKRWFDSRKVCKLCIILIVGKDLISLVFIFLQVWSIALLNHVSSSLRQIGIDNFEHDKLKIETTLCMLQLKVTFFS